MLDKNRAFLNRTPKRHQCRVAAVRFPKGGYTSGGDRSTMSEEDIIIEQVVIDGIKYVVGDIIPERVTTNGTYVMEQVVQVHCQVCGAGFKGPIREAGGFLGGHECYHRWEMLLATMPEA